MYLVCPNCDIFPYICKLIDKRTRNYIHVLPLNKTHSEIKTDEDETMNINNNTIVNRGLTMSNLCHLLT